MNDQKNVKIWKIVGIIVLVLLVVKIFDGGWRGKDVQKDTISVSGKGEVVTKPDMATVSFSVTEENKDVSKASDAVNVKIAKIVESLQASGIEEKDIKTTGYNIYPRYDYVASQTYPYNVGRQVLAAYVVTQSIEIKIRDLGNAGKIITDLGTLKVTDMSGLNFTNDKYDDLVRQARDMAIKDAREQAKVLAKALGVRVKKIVGYTEGGNYPIYYTKATPTAYGMGGDAESAVVPTGENKITSNVTITYEIR